MAEKGIGEKENCDPESIYPFFLGNKEFKFKP